MKKLRNRNIFKEHDNQIEVTEEIQEECSKKKEGTSRGKQQSKRSGGSSLDVPKKD